MLVSLNVLLQYAEANNQAIGAFNVTGLEMIQSVIAAAEKENQPVIMQFAQIHEQEHVAELDVLGPIMVMMADKASVPICVHLDHAVDLSYIRKALDYGFTSVMYDGSSLPYEENVANTRIAKEIAAQYDADVEAEIGVMSGTTLNDKKEVENRGQSTNMYTDPTVAKQFVRATGIDCLACAFGTVHGLYKSEPRLDFDLVEALNKEIGIPIVMHGGSGVSEADFRKVISRGVRKINYYTYMAKSGGDAFKQCDEQITYFHEYANIAKAAMEENIRQAIHIFKNEEEVLK